MSQLSALDVVARLVVLFGIFANLEGLSAAESGYLFPGREDYDDLEWTTISALEAVQLADSAIARQPQYGSARGYFLLYLADGFKSERSSLIELFGKMRESDQLLKLREMTAPILRHRSGFRHKLNWAQIQIIEDGDNVLEKCVDAEFPSAYLSTNEEKVVFEGATKQVDIALPGLQNRTLVRSLAFFTDPLQSVDEQTLRSAAKTSDLVKLVRGADGGPIRTSIFSLRDGLIIYDRTVATDGNVLKETWQGGAKVWAGGVRFPLSLLRFAYSNGEVTDIEAAVLKDAAFNVSVKPSEFTIAVPAGTTIVDVRNGEPEVVRSKQAIDDVVKALQKGLPTVARPVDSSMIGASANSTDSSISWRTIFFLVNAIVVLILVIVIIRSRIKASM